MDKNEARGILQEFMDDLQTRAREELLGLIANPACVERTGNSGAVYQIEYEALWDAEPGGDLRVMAAIDDGRLHFRHAPGNLRVRVTPRAAVPERVNRAAATATTIAARAATRASACVDVSRIKPFAD